MTFRTYVKDNAGFVAALAASGLLSYCVLAGGGVGAQAIWPVLALEWLCPCAWFLLRYAKVRVTAGLLARVADSDAPLDEVSAVPEAPDAVGERAFDALEAVVADARRRNGALAADLAERTRYAEAWVHEIKTPIATAGLVLENNPGAGVSELQEELERIDGYVEQALYFSKARVAEKDYVVRPTDMRALVNDAVKSRKRLLIAARVRMDVGDVDAMVLTDEKWMRFVLGQLLDNAVKYRSSDRPQEVRIWGERLDEGGARERYVLHVQDAGRGIPEPDLGRVFDPGFTGSNGRGADVRASTGMGLYIVKTLCDKLGVGIHVASDSVSYTEFELAFPMNMMRHVGRAG